jgi:hypothetical protein
MSPKVGYYQLERVRKRKLNKCKRINGPTTMVAVAGVICIGIMAIAMILESNAESLPSFYSWTIL